MLLLFFYQLYFLTTEQFSREASPLLLRVCPPLCQTLPKTLPSAHNETRWILIKEIDIRGAAEEPADAENQAFI